jgi:RNA recognition motif-containing protein
MQLNSTSSTWYPPPGLPPINSLPLLNKPLIPLTIIDDVNEVEFENNNCIFVTRLPSYTTRENIIDFFSKYGSIHKIDFWNIDKHYCHVYMKSVADANKIVNMKNFDFLGVTITVEFAIQKESKNSKKFKLVWESFCVKLIKAIKSIPDENKYGVSYILIAKEITDIFREKDIETGYTLFRELVNDHRKIINAVANAPSIIAASNSL